MKFSLVLATVDRTQEVKRFLDSLCAQQHPNVELIVVDQNLDTRIEMILHGYRDQIDIRHLRSERGLSRARNAGLQHVGGDIVGFPDDDCWYPPGVLTTVVKFLEGHPGLDGITGRSEDGNKQESGAKFSRRAGLVDVFSVWGQGISYAIFLRRAVIERVGLFDETLGVGAGTRYGSGEETDYLIRTLRTGSQVFYSPDLVIFHPNPIRELDDKALRRAKSYGGGMGRVLSKHAYPAWFVTRVLIRPLGGMVVSLLTLRLRKATYYYNVAIGRLSGFIYGRR